MQYKKQTKLPLAPPQVRGKGTLVNRGSKAFTLVELIVVVTILAILATIGFVSYSSYLTGVRDTNRISQLSSISDGLNLYSTKNSLPLPEDSVEVQVNGETIAYQGYAGSNTLETIDFTKGGQDPKDDTYFSYYLTDDRKYFQLMAFLEEADSLTFIPSPGRGGLGRGITLAADYEDRYPTVTGRKLGILTDDVNSPIQEVITDTLDITSATTETYRAHFKNDNIFEGTGIELEAKILLNINFEPKFNPKGVDGLFMWFDATDPDTIEKDSSNIISKWEDKSGNNNDFDVIEGDPSYGDYKINGQKTVYFDGTDSMHTTASFDAPYTIMYVAQMEGTQNARVLGGDYNSLIGFYAENKNDLYLDGGWVLNSSEDAGINTELFSLTRDTSLATSFYNNGQTLALTAETGGTTDFGNLWIGGAGPSGGGASALQKSKVQMAEILIFDEVISDEDRVDIEAYLNAKWGPF